MDYSISKASLEDFDDARLIIDEYCEQVGVVVRDSAEDIRHYVEDQDSGIWLAYADDLPFGCILLRPLKNLDRAGEIKRLYVRSEYRGQGIAERLLVELEQHAGNLHLQWLYLDTKDDLHAAIRFYERQGYVHCERYNDNPQATMFLRKRLEGYDKGLEHD